MVGFYVFNPPQTYPVALDTNAPYAQRSYTSIDGTTFTVFQGTPGGNFGIRALATVSSGNYLIRQPRRRPLLRQLAEIVVFVGHSG